MKKSLLVIIILAALLAGCGAPGQSPEAIQAQVNTAVAQTLEVEDQIAKSVVLTVDAQVPLSTPTAEVVPTATPITIPTFTPVVPTVTPVAIIPPSGGGSGGSSSGGASSPKSKIYSCAIVGEKPYDGASFRPGDSFDKSWTIKNTGSATWEAGWEFEYKGGEDMSPTGDFLIGQQVKPGGTITLVIEVDAPKITQKDSGKVFVMTWSLNNGSHFCTPYVAIKVFTP
ncbi:MAG TPA: NBR1-Ig-like domain-containing protein [Anaerolineales bacterium]|nr:NBR1-Ig-like domain-containing protein [Anaerolineales bacterium]